MALAVEKLKAFACAAAAPSTPINRRVVAETGLPVVFNAAVDPIQSAVEAMMAGPTDPGCTTT